jgi:hypothetical protein
MVGHSTSCIVAVGYLKKVDYYSLAFGFGMG